MNEFIFSYNGNQVRIEAPDRETAIEVFKGIYPELG